MNAEKTEIMNNLRDWATLNKDVVCVVCAGSHGNKEKERVADDLSDLDIVLFTGRLKFYLSDMEWLKEIGEVAYHYTDKSDIPGIPGIRKIFFANGVRVDLLFWKKSMLKTAYNYLSLKQKTIFIKLLPVIVRKIIEARFSYFPKYIRRGFETIVDKQNYAHKIEYIERNNRFRQAAFSQEKLQFTVDRFWAISLSTAVYIHRGDLFAAKVLGDRSMKQLLLHLIELYTKLSKGRDHDMWQDGRYLEDWGPQFITKRLKNIFGRYDADDSWRAAMETIDLFSHICERLSAEHPEIKFSNPEEHFRKCIHAVGAARIEAVPEL